MGFRTERWLIKPLSCPRPIRYCPDCGMAREFVCSERFRVNAQKKVIDVWLNYRCAECGDVWKLPVIERQPVTGMASELHDAFARHDQTTVWKFAFDLAHMRSHVLRVNAEIEFAVERTLIDCNGETIDTSQLEILFDAPFACDIRLDRLLAMELQVSRATIARWLEDETLLVEPDHRAINRAVRAGTRVLIRRHHVSANGRTESR